MKKILLIISAICIALSFQLPAQKLALEKTYEISRKAKRGYLDSVGFDNKTQTTRLTFVTKSSNSLTGSSTKVKYEYYTFDKEFNFVKVDEEEAVYHNKKYKGETYSLEGISVENNLFGTFVLKKKRTTYTWNWFYGGYKVNVELLEKLKPKDEAGNKYTLVKAFENSATGEAIALVHAKGKGANPNEYTFIKIGLNLEMQVTDKIVFDSPQVMADYDFIADLSDKADDADVDEDSEGSAESDGDLATSNIGFVFASSSEGKKKGADAHDYTFLRVNALGKILDRVAIKTAASVWNINQLIADGDNIYILGPAKEAKYYDQTVAAAKDLDDMKWKLFQMCKITKSKVEYVTTTDLDEFESKLQKPASQKKSPSYSGKKFKFASASVMSNGSVFICGQNYSKNNKGIVSYQDVIMFNFDNAGKLKAQYGIRREENNKEAKKYPARQMIDEGTLGVYWTIFEVAGIHTEKEGKVKVSKLDLYPSVARIDPASGAIGEFSQYGTVKDNPVYFLNNSFPFLQVSVGKEKSILYFGNDKSSRTLWFGKVVLE